MFPYRQINYGKSSNDERVIYTLYKYRSNIQHYLQHTKNVILLNISNMNTKLNLRINLSEAIKQYFERDTLVAFPSNEGNVDDIREMRITHRMPRAWNIMGEASGRI